MYVAGDAIAPGAFGPAATAGAAGTTSAVLAYLSDATLTPLAARVASASSTLQVFPNPAAGCATLTGAAPGAAVEVLDLLGRCVGTATAGSDGITALMLPVGLYLVRTGAQVTRLVVK